MNHKHRLWKSISALSLILVTALSGCHNSPRIATEKQLEVDTDRISDEARLAPDEAILHYDNKIIRFTGKILTVDRFADWNGDRWFSVRGDNGGLIECMLSADSNYIRSLQVNQKVAIVGRCKIQKAIDTWVDVRVYQVAPQ